MAATLQRRRRAGTPKIRTPAKTAPLPLNQSEGALPGAKLALVVVIANVIFPLVVAPPSVSGPPVTVQPIRADAGALQVKLIVPL